MPKERQHLLLATEVAKFLRATGRGEVLPGGQEAAFLLGAISPDCHFYDAPGFALTAVGDALHGENAAVGLRAVMTLLAGETEWKPSDFGWMEARARGEREKFTEAPRKTVTAGCATENPRGSSRMEARAGDEDKNPPRPPLEKGGADWRGAIGVDSVQGVHEPPRRWTEDAASPSFAEAGPPFSGSKDEIAAPHMDTDHPSSIISPLFQRGAGGISGAGLPASAEAPSPPGTPRSGKAPHGPAASPAERPGGTIHPSGSGSVVQLPPEARAYLLGVASHFLADHLLHPIIDHLAALRLPPASSRTGQAYTTPPGTPSDAPVLNGPSSATLSARDRATIAALSPRDRHIWIESELDACWTPRIGPEDGFLPLFARFQKDHAFRRAHLTRLREILRCAGITPLPAVRHLDHAMSIQIFMLRGFCGGRFTRIRERLLRMGGFARYMGSLIVPRTPRLPQWLADLREEDPALPNLAGGRFLARTVATIANGLGAL